MRRAASALCSTNLLPFFERLATRDSFNSQSLLFAIVRLFHAIIRECKRLRSCGARLPFWHRNIIQLPRKSRVTRYPPRDRTTRRDADENARFVLPAASGGRRGLFNLMSHIPAEMPYCGYAPDSPRNFECDR